MITYYNHYIAVESPRLSHMSCPNTPDWPLLRTRGARDVPDVPISVGLDIDDMTQTMEGVHKWMGHFRMGIKTW